MNTRQMLAGSQRKVLFALAAFFFSGISSVYAQALEEITVTAQKRAQTAQDVPLAVTAVAGDVLDDFGITNFEGLNVPGLTVQRGGMADVVTIRGVGSDTNLGFEQSVPTYIDGVYYGRARIQRYAFLDVERIEVLKGPQPTYLGKNAIAGAISISTRKPGREFAANVRLLNEFEHGEIIVEGGVDIPLSDTAAVRFAGKYRELDGWVKNIAIGADEPQIEDSMFRGTLVWDISDAVDVTVQAYTGSNKDDGRNNQPFNCQPTYFSSGISDPLLEDCVIDDIKASMGEVPVGPSGGDPLFYQSKNGTGLNDLSVTGANATVNFAIGEATLTSVTAWYELENKMQADGDHGTSNFFTANFWEEFDQFSQELRLVSSRGEKVEWSAGVNFDKNTNDNLQAPNINTGALSQPFPGLPAMGMAFTRHRDVQEDAESWAVFADITFHISDTFRASVGARYTDVTKDADILVCSATLFTRNCFQQPNQSVVSFAFTDSLSQDDLQPSVVLEWEPNDDVNTYLSYKEGFKAGGFDHSLNTPDLNAFSYLPENVKAIELGAKFRLLDGRLRLDMAVFDNQFENMQVSIFSGVGINFNVANAAESTARGLEIDANFAATDNITLGAAVQFLDSEFSEYADAPCYSRQTEAQGCVPDPNGGASTQNLTGRPRPMAPDYTATLKADWDYPIKSTLAFTGGIEVYLTDDFYTIADLDPVSEQPGFEKVSARIGIGSADGTWNVSLIGRNLTNEITAPWRGDCPFGVCTIALVDRTRTVALQLSANF